jgi:hypothetical protein
MNVGSSSSCLITTPTELTRLYAQHCKNDLIFEIKTTKQDHDFFGKKRNKSFENFISNTGWIFSTILNERTRRKMFMLFIPYIFLQSIHQQTYALNKIHSEV